MRRRGVFGMTGSSFTYAFIQQFLICKKSCFIVTALLDNFVKNGETHLFVDADFFKLCF